MPTEPSRARRARARARLAAKARRHATADLRVFDALELVQSRAPAAVNEIPLAAVAGTIEPGRAPCFDRRFRPARAARSRWLAIWMAERRGVILPPISVVSVGNGYAVRDGHHRVSVALARGAVTIDAVVH